MYLVETLEIIFVKIRFNVNLFICCLYVPPSRNEIVYRNLCNAFNRFIETTHCKPDDIILICIDFNCPSVKWVNDSDNANISFPFNCSPVFVQELFNVLFCNSLDQVNFIHKLLDLVI